ncbi:DUF3304 domain-containing protein, partial [Duffyella gerundensis]
QGGGGGCCFGAPSTWYPGMTVRVDWETSIAYASDIPEIPQPERPDLAHLDVKTADLKAIEYAEKYQVWRQKVKSLNKQHSMIVPVPDYTG